MKLEDQYLNNEISSDEYLEATGKVSVLSGLFLTLGIILLDYFAFPYILGSSYISWGVLWTLPLGVCLSYLFYMYHHRIAIKTIKSRDENFK